MPKYATTDEEAEVHLLAYCEQIGSDKQWFSDDAWKTVIRIARDKDYGYEEADKAVFEEKRSRNEAAKRQERRQRLDNDPDGFLDAIDGDPQFNDTDVKEMLQECADAYVGGQRVNLEFGRAMTRTEYTAARGLWQNAAAHSTPAGVFGAFHDYDPEDKQALGKGNVGGTLAKRKVQGNLLVRIGHVKFNMHINITGN